jgi:hypothetical protein
VRYLFIIIDPLLLPHPLRRAAHLARQLLAIVALVHEETILTAWAYTLSEVGETAYILLEPGDGHSRNIVE